METDKERLLSVSDLVVSFQNKRVSKEVVHGISFEIRKGEIVGIVGESGSGKSVSALSIMKLLPDVAKVSGEILFDGKLISNQSERSLERLRGKEVSYIFQEPMTSLNPVYTIGQQLYEVLKLHTDCSAEQQKTKILTMLSKVGLLNGEELLSCYPHQLSGGMRQRVMIAMAMLLQPKLLIADEPTTALDVTIQKKILELLKSINREMNTSILFISHDLAVIQHICDRVLVMYQGEIVEQGTTKDIFESPQNEYTKQLLQASKMVHTYERMEQKEKNGLKDMLTVENVSIAYGKDRRGLFHKTKAKEVIHPISFQVREGEILGIVGESGSGKSTLMKAVVGLIPIKDGSMIKNCANPQMVFQDPYSSLNPSRTIGWLLEEPLRLVKEKIDASTRQKMVYEMLDKIGLSKEYADRYPQQLSGGQRQRVAIGMAMMNHSKLIVLDEPVSALDVTVQEQILKLLLSLRKEFSLTYIFVSHDMGVIKKICDRVLVLHQGTLIEENTAEQLFQSPKEEYTKELLGAVL